MRRYPLVVEIDIPFTAPQCFEYFRNLPFAFFLDSGMDPGRTGRYSLMGAEPFLVLRSRGDEITLILDGKEETRKGNPFDVAGELFKLYALDNPAQDMPFTGGAVGYFSYDLCHFIERLPKTAVDDLQLPECYLAFYDVAVVFDHLKGKSYLVSSGFPKLDEDRRIRRAQERLTELRDGLSRCSATALEPEPALSSDSMVLRSNFSHQDYLKAVAIAREYICAGDIFQVNLSQRFETDLTVSPYALYQRLRHINPAPFAGYLGFDKVAVVSASPELFLKVRGDHVETRPIKGTRPRGTTAAQDEALAQELLASSKDRAENVMIVDLERNDIGRVCRYGTVKVTELAMLETFPTVFHLTSTVAGRLLPDKNCVDLLKATFPGGSITGAPKVRAMEIIDELEPTCRSIYTGSIGYISFSGEMDLNIAIRTLFVKDGRAYFQAGGGIVYDSDPEEEYQETLAKAKALIQALGISSGVAVEAAP